MTSGIGGGNKVPCKEYGYWQVLGRGIYRVEDFEFGGDQLLV